MFEQIEWLDYQLGFWTSVVALVWFAYELAWRGAKKFLSWNEVFDAVTSIITLVVSLTLVPILYFAAFFAFSFYAFQNWAFFEIELNWTSVIIALLLADFIYYWEHRFFHEWGFLWTTHSVHHSSPYFNVSVAYRFGPLDSPVSSIFHFPLILIGFNPFVVLFASTFNQYFQFWLHTERIGKLGPLEWFLNTPSHHRVHHGSDEKYLDKNYGGILIIWDRMFGTFQEEEETPTYGLVKPIESNNPFTVTFHGFTRFFAKLASARSVGEFFNYFFRDPGWMPEDLREDHKEKAVKEAA